MKKKTPIPPDQVIKKDVILFNRSGSKRDESPEFIIPLKSSSTVRMKSFFNSVYATKKTPNKLKATPKAVVLTMKLLLSSQARRHRCEKHRPKTNSKPRISANNTVMREKVKLYTRRLLFC